MVLFRRVSHLQTMQNLPCIFPLCIPLFGVLPILNYDNCFNNKLLVKKLGSTILLYSGKQTIIFRLAPYLYILNLENINNLYILNLNRKQYMYFNKTMLS